MKTTEIPGQEQKREHSRKPAFESLSAWWFCPTWLRWLRMICFRSQAQNSKSVHSDSLPCLLLGSHLTSATFCFLIGKKAQHYVPQRIASHTRWCIERQFVKPPAVHSSFPVMPQIYFAPLSFPPPLPDLVSVVFKCISKTHWLENCTNLPATTVSRL